jgi:LPPG:FO 2-phospho-L-lactate transferase
VLALSGGVGGAKLALGFYRILPRDTLTVVANTGDDFTHLGLSVSPDIDTLLYTLSGLANEEQGWGRRDETWTFMAALERLGGESWFRLGDGDLATHVERTRRLAAGESLTAITDHFARRLGIAARILPMSDERVRTRIHSTRGWLDFQDYFVRLRCEPVVRQIVFAGAADAAPHGDAIALLRDPALRLVVICPSNPFISIDPILSLPGMRAALRDCPAPVVAVSPIIGGKAVKGPTAKMMEELGLPVGAAAVARHYGDLIDVYVADDEDADAVSGLDVPVVLTRTLMTGLAEREALARTILAAPERIPT